VAAHAPSVCILMVAPGQHVAINTFACKHQARVRPSSFPPRKQRLQSITGAVSITIAYATLPHPGETHFARSPIERVNTIARPLTDRSNSSAHATEECRESSRRVHRQSRQGAFPTTECAKLRMGYL